MSSLFDQLNDKLRQDPSYTKRGGPRVDLSLLLFGAREELRELWQAAERYVQSEQPGDLESLKGAVEKLRPVFGPRPTPGRPS